MYGSLVLVLTCALHVNKARLRPRPEDSAKAPEHSQKGELPQQPDGKDHDPQGREDDVHEGMHDHTMTTQKIHEKSLYSAIAFESIPGASKSHCHLHLLREILSAR